MGYSNWKRGRRGGEGIKKRVLLGALVTTARAGNFQGMCMKSRRSGEGGLAMLMAETATPTCVRVNS